MPWRILVVDDHPAVRRSLRTLLAAIPEFKVCGEAENGQQGVERAGQLHPDAVILDVSMPVMRGFHPARIIKSTMPSTKILMFTSLIHTNLSEMAIAEGEDRAISKESPPSDLINAPKDILVRIA